MKRDTPEERATASAKARQAMLERFKQRSGPGDPAWEAKQAELEAVAGVKPMLISGVSGEGVTELLRAAYRQVRVRRGDAVAEIEDDEDHVEETPGGWQP